MQLLSCNFCATYFRKRSVVQSDDFPVIPGHLSQSGTRTLDSTSSVLFREGGREEGLKSPRFGESWAVERGGKRSGEKGLCNFCATFDFHSAQTVTGVCIKRAYEGVNTQ